MKALCLSCLLALGSASLWAQSPAPATAKDEKLVVHQVAFTHVTSEKQLLGIIEYIEHLGGIRSVKRLDLDKKTNEALIEFSGDPSIENRWRAYLEDMPKGKVNVSASSKDLSRQYPDWFKPKK